MNKENAVYTHTHTHTWGYFSAVYIKKEDPVICDNIAGSGKHYAKRNKPVTGQILQDLTYV